MYEGRNPNIRRKTWFVWNEAIEISQYDQISHVVPRGAVSISLKLHLVLDSQGIAALKQETSPFLLTLFLFFS